MSKEDISQEFRLKNVDETRNFLTEEINQNELMSKKYKQFIKVFKSFELYYTFTYSNFCSYWMHFHFCFCFVSWYSYRNYEFCNRVKICVLNVGIKKHKSIIKEKKKKKHDKILSSAKS